MLKHSKFLLIAACIAFSGTASASFSFKPVSLKSIVQKVAAKASDEKAEAPKLIKTPVLSVLPVLAAVFNTSAIKLAEKHDKFESTVKYVFGKIKNNHGNHGGGHGNGNGNNGNGNNGNGNGNGHGNHGGGHGHHGGHGWGCHASKH